MVKFEKIFGSKSKFGGRKKARPGYKAILHLWLSPFFLVKAGCVHEESDSCIKKAISLFLILQLRKA